MGGSSGCILLTSISWGYSTNTRAARAMIANVQPMFGGFHSLTALRCSRFTGCRGATVVGFFRPKIGPFWATLQHTFAGRNLRLCDLDRQGIQWPWRARREKDYNYVLKWLQKQWIYPLKMVIFHSYVRLSEGIPSLVSRFLEPILYPFNPMVKKN